MKMIDIIGKRKYFFILSIALILIGVLFYIINGGFNWDIQFEGGTIIKLEMVNNDYDQGAVEANLESLVGKDLTLQKETTYNPEDNANTISLLSVKVSKTNTLTSDEKNMIIDELTNSGLAVAGADIQIQSVEPFIGTEMRNKALSAAAIAIVLIVLYVWLRFRVMSGLAAALCGIIALLHDALIMLAVYTVFNIPVNEIFIAAILTIIGYSMNDTIVIYDRVRENTGIMHKSDIETLVNTSINQSLPRTINTLLTTLMTIIILYVFAVIFNVGSIKQFAFPLIIGLTSGSYSSIFIATPLWMMWKKREHLKKKLTT
ncbi:MAG: protein translocase subunit SecF [Clostridia bacterium]|nr:protein translocase subunit SecF [Clostridia bacterium]